MAAPDFWSNRERAQGEVEEVSRLRALINPFKSLNARSKTLPRCSSLLREEKRSWRSLCSCRSEVATEHDRLVHKLSEFELRQFLSGENDRANAFLTIHLARARNRVMGSDMPLRMYQRWIERSGYKSQTVDIRAGRRSRHQISDPARIGEYAYGHRQTERGVHRLARSRPLMQTNGGTLPSPVLMLFRKLLTQPRLKLIRPIWRSTRSQRRQGRSGTSTRWKPAVNLGTLKRNSGCLPWPSAARDATAS
jgi:protein subunit release factor A